jgi:protocatechuate 3,4-dioxygenase beta subunit
MLFTRRAVVAGAALASAGAAAAAGLKTTSLQTIGPFYPLVRPADQDWDMTRLTGASGPPKGKAINIVGRVRARDGTPVGGARLDIWQANAAGRYAHGGDTNPAPLDPNFQGSARIAVARDGTFRIRTIKPAPYPTESGRLRTPHIHFDVSGNAQRIVTQMYFDDETLNATDFVRETALDPGSLTAVRAADLSDDPGTPVYRWDIVLAAG